jgi:hypothetical protein
VDSSPKKVDSSPKKWIHHLKKWIHHLKKLDSSPKKWIHHQKSGFITQKVDSSPKKWIHQFLAWPFRGLADKGPNLPLRAHRDLEIFIGICWHRSCPNRGCSAWVWAVFGIEKGV